MTLPTAEETAKALTKRLGTRTMMRRRWRIIYEVSDRDRLGKAFRDSLVKAALAEGLIIGYGKEYVVLARDG